MTRMERVWLQITKHQAVIDELVFCKFSQGLSYIKYQLSVACIPTYKSYNHHYMKRRNFLQQTAMAGASLFTAGGANATLNMCLTDGGVLIL